jgi:stage III sporulation protein AH
MVLKRQTVWLLTMLSLMVVLSAYYLLNKPMDSELMTDHLEESFEWFEYTEDTDIFSFTDGANMDHFISIRMDRDHNRALLEDEFYSLMNSQDSTAQTIAQARNEYHQLKDLTDAEMTIETLIRSEGFDEAVVIAEQDRVDVVVRSDEALENIQVVKIIQLVRNVIDVSGHQVSVSYR